MRIRIAKVPVDRGRLVVAVLHDTALGYYYRSGSRVGIVVRVVVEDSSYFGGAGWESASFSQATDLHTQLVAALN